MFTSENNRAFHPKAYSFIAPDGTRVSYVGSANLTRPALVRSVEWCYRIEDPQDLAGNEEIRRAFESLWNDANCVPLTQEWVEEYRLRRPAFNQRAATEVELEPAPPPPKPREIQKEALHELEATRAVGNRAGLVVMATGLGKTWLAAFDADAFEAKRILFVAHREEILRQACAVFRNVMPQASFGFYRQGDHQTDPGRVLFASVQTNAKRISRESP